MHPCTPVACCAVLCFISCNQRRMHVMISFSSILKILANHIFFLLYFCLIREFEERIFEAIVSVQDPSHSFLRPSLPLPLIHSFTPPPSLSTSHTPSLSDVWYGVMYLSIICFLSFEAILILIFPLYQFFYSTNYLRHKRQLKNMKSHENELQRWT